MDVMRDPDPIEIWLPYVVVYAFMLGLFTVCQLKKDNSIIDIFWGTLLFIPLWVVIGLSGNTNPRPLVVACLVTIWGIRIAVNIGMRHNGEDFRYVEMRDALSDKGECCVYLGGFGLFFGQTTFAQINNASAFYAVLLSEEGFTILDGFGVGVWAIGFAIEVVADLQLEAFKNNPENRGRLLKTGLWRYSRHPNYFGEAVLWWGVYLLSASVKYGYYTFPSALMITLALRFVTGVPIMEKRLQSKPGFEAYAASTNAMMMWCPKEQAITP
jgi:steroid 5-alpha reductase family enzyme